MSSSDYSKAYESAKQELADLLATQERLEKRKVDLRKTIETLAALCESEDVAIDPSQEAAYLLKHSSLADEIRSILKTQYPGWQRPHQVKGELERLGHDLSKYDNPQATIHMVLKRMYQSGEVQETTSEDGKKIYRCPPVTFALAETLKDLADVSQRFTKTVFGAQGRQKVYAAHAAYTIHKKGGGKNC